MDDDARMRGLVPPLIDDAAAPLVPAKLGTLLAGVVTKLPAVVSLALESCTGALIELPLALELLDPRP